MTSLRLLGTPAADIDLVLVRSADRIVRADRTLWVTVAPGSCADLRRRLALAGIGTVEEDAPVPRHDLVQSLGLGLAPASEPAIEILLLRRVPLAESTSRALGARSLRRLVPAYRSPRERACRELLHGTDELAWWERRAWLTAGALRLAEVRRVFRPIVFDRGALASPRPGGLVRARDGSITRWAFG